jgi:hypothetical protein
MEESKKPEKLREVTELTIVEVILIVFIAVLIAYSVYVEFNLWALILTLFLMTTIYVGFYKYLHTFANKESLLWTAFGVFAVFIYSFETTKTSNGFYLLLVVLIFACLLFFVVKHVIFLLLMFFQFIYITSVLLVQHICRINN